MTDQTAAVIKVSSSHMWFSGRISTEKVETTHYSYGAPLPEPIISIPRSQSITTCHLF